jgi:cytochrome c biogenesis protein CcdA
MISNILFILGFLILIFYMVKGFSNIKKQTIHVIIGFICICMGLVLKPIQKNKNVEEKINFNVSKVSFQRQHSI